MCQSACDSTEGQEVADNAGSPLLCGVPLLEFYILNLQTVHAYRGNCTTDPCDVIDSDQYIIVYTATKSNVIYNVFTPITV